jgi:hypothetical protein
MLKKAKQVAVHAKARRSNHHVTDPQSGVGVRFDGPVGSAVWMAAIRPSADSAR